MLSRPYPATSPGVAGADADNPWLALQWRPPFVLPQDALGASPYTTSLPPGPWYGPLTNASVVLLMLMPGVGEQDFLDITDPDFMDMSRDQLTSNARFPWHLRRWRNTGGGSYWWPRLKRLVSDSSEEAVADALAVAQIYPYHSVAWQAPTGDIPSQSYTATLVRRAISRRALIVSMMGWRRWTEMIPELAHADFIRALNPRTTYLTPGNLGINEYARLGDRLAAADR